MTTTFSALANPSAEQATIVGRSGNSYTADSYGIIRGISPQDILDVEQAGCKIIALDPSPPLQPSRFYGIPFGATLTTLLTVASTIYAYPFFVPNQNTLKTLNASVTTGQTGGKVRLAVYSSKFGLPNALIAGTDSGDLAATTTALATSSALGVPLPSGLYWLALQAAATSTMPSVEALASVAGSVLASQLGYDTAAHALAGSGEYATGVSATQTYGAPPAAFPTPTFTQSAATPAIAIGV